MARSKRQSAKAYGTWSSMRTRCNNEKSAEYRWYGAKGVKVCERWKDYETFLADMGHPDPDLELDRIDPTGNYCPSNCRWVTRIEQMQNLRNTLWITAHGFTLTTTQWSARTGIKKKTIYDRVARYGWSHEDAVTYKADKRGWDHRRVHVETPC